MADPARVPSWWGWGYEDAQLDDTARAAVATGVAALLGIDPPPVRPLPDLAAVTLPEPRLAPPPQLDAVVTADREARLHHTHGRAFPDIARALAGDFAAAPDLVALPADEESVAAVLAWASQAGVAVVPFGGGTSVVGGVTVPPERDRPVVALDLTRLDRLLDVDPVSHAARVQAGLRGPAVEAALGEHGLTLRFFPQSFEMSTVGGWVATRAGGHFATGPTHIDDLVESLRLVTPAGVLESRRLPASGAGPSPDRLVLGSEGALGVVTEAWLRVRPRPLVRRGASVHLDGPFEAAADAVRAIVQAGLQPANCRLLSAEEAALNGVAADGAHVLVLGFESADEDPAPLDTALARAVGLAERHGGRAVERDSSGSWRAAFLQAPYLASALVSLGLVVDTFETACTWDRFPGLHRRVSQDVSEAMQDVCGGGRLTVRFTHAYPDGPAPYYTFLAQGRPGEQVGQWEAVKRAASEAVLAAGGTITHHHAVGRTHRPWYDRQRPELFAAALRSVKRELDPAGVMNPGVLV